MLAQAEEQLVVEYDGLTGRPMMDVLKGAQDWSRCVLSSSPDDRILRVGPMGGLTCCGPGHCQGNGDNDCHNIKLSS